MKPKRFKRAVRALTHAVDHGAITKQEASAVLALGASIGYFGRPDAVEPSESVRTKGQRMAKLKAKSNPASLAGTKAGGLFNGARVKDASERLSSKKYEIKGKDGNPLRWGSKTVETASERDQAIVGIYFKNTLRKQGVPGIVLSDWEKSLLAEHVERGRWCGEVGGHYYGGGQEASDFVPNATVKALLDDTVSGGLFLTPYEFDSNVVTFPLLNGEVFPMVDVVPVTGRRIEGARMSNLSVTWGTNPGTAVQPFNTSALVSELSTPVYPVTGALELDNNMLVDSPVAIGAMVTGLYGERMKSELDRVITSGNGYNEPLGITNTTGLVNVISDNGAAGPPTVSDYEGLIFSVPKQYRAKDWNPAFLANDTSYRRARGIAVGPGDERRVFGMDHESYTLLDYPYKIQNDMPNTRILFGCWRRYRMYQRLGSEVVVERGGRQLALSNMTLIVVRSRYGGQPIDANAFALMTNSQQ